MNKFYLLLVAFVLVATFVLAKIWQNKTAKAVFVTAFMVPILGIYAIKTAFLLWLNAIKWTFTEYRRKLHAVDHEDAGL